MKISLEKYKNILELTDISVEIIPSEEKVKIKIKMNTAKETRGTP